MARTEAKLNSILISQQLDDEMWGIGWNEDTKKLNMEAVRHDLELARGGNIAPLTNGIKNLLESTGHEVRDCYGILHNKDVREVWSETERKMVIDPKPLHGHWVVYFQSGGGDSIGNLAAALGLPPQQLEKTQKGKFGYDNSLAYLVHVKYADKHQYDPREVCTVAGRPYAEIASERWEAWLKGRSSITRKNALEGIDDLEQRILDGRVCYNQVILTDEYFAVYARNKRRCDDAFEVYSARRAFKTMQALENGEFTVSVFFLTGKSGDGKTKLAKTFINKLVEESAKAGEAWRVCSCAASNPMDEYSGEEIVWLDDVRGTAMSASDWLKLLDPENASPASARYHNKKVASCRCVVITSEKDVVEFFYYCKQGNGQSEAIDQFMRRIQSRVQVIRTGYEKDAPRLYRIADSVKMGVPEDMHLPGTMDSVSYTYRFGFTEELADLNDTAETLVNRVVYNNPVFFKEKHAEVSVYEFVGNMARANLELEDNSKIAREEQERINRETAWEVYHEMLNEYKNGRLEKEPIPPEPPAPNGTLY